MVNRHRHLCAAETTRGHQINGVNIIINVEVDGIGVVVAYINVANFTRLLVSMSYASIFYCFK